MARPLTTRCFLLIIASGALAGPALAKDEPEEPTASLAIEPIFAQSLLAPAEPDSPHQALRLSLIDAERAGLLAPPPYRLQREGDSATGKRATLSVAVGDTTLFATSGKLTRRARPAPADAVETNALASRKLDSGRLYGAGVERRLGSVDVSASYQFSRISSGQLELPDGDRAKSHSLQLRARLGF